MEIYFAMVMEEWEVILQWCVKEEWEVIYKGDGGVGSYFCKGEGGVGSYLQR